MAGTVRIRRDAWALQAEHTADAWPPALLWYARAVARMQSRSITDPTSWRYQAAIHDYDPFGDPLGNEGEQLPPQAERDRFWSQCQHGSWYFLPWHRWYLHYYEQIVRSTIAELVAAGTFVGRKDIASSWALP